MSILETVLAVEKEKRVQELIRLGNRWKTDKGSSIDEIERLARKLADEEFKLIDLPKGPR